MSVLKESAVTLAVQTGGRGSVTIRETGHESRRFLPCWSHVRDDSNPRPDDTIATRPDTTATSPLLTQKASHLDCLSCAGCSRSGNRGSRPRDPLWEKWSVRERRSVRLPLGVRPDHSHFHPWRSVRFGPSATGPALLPSLPPPRGPAPPHRCCTPAAAPLPLLAHGG